MSQQSRHVQSKRPGLERPVALPADPADVAVFDRQATEQLHRSKDGSRRKGMAAAFDAATLHATVCHVDVPKDDSDCHFGGARTVLTLVDSQEWQTSRRRMRGCRFGTARTGNS